MTISRSTMVCQWFNRRAFGCCAVLLLLLVSGCWQKPSNIQYLTDQQGRALILHGINSSSSAKNPETGHLPWVSPEDVYQETVEWGFNFVRLLIFWDGIEPEKGVYDSDYLDAVAERVKWYTDNGAYVMLDMHQDIYGHAVGGNGAPEWATETSLMERFSLDFAGLPWWIKNIDPSVIAAFMNFWQYDQHRYLQDHYIAAWQHVARRFKDNPRVIAYDLMNEPHAGDLAKAASFRFEATWLIGLYDRLIPALREIDQDKWLAFEPQSLAVNFGLPSKLPFVSDTRVGERRLAYAPHIYPFALHEGIAYNLVDKKQMLDWNRHRSAELDLQQVPLIVGEFGGSDNTPGFGQYLIDVLAMFDTMGASWAYWSNDPGSWGLLDGEGNETAKVDHLVRPYARAIAGQPLGFGYDPETQHYWLSFIDKIGVTAETEIFIPKRHFPHGWQLHLAQPQQLHEARWDQERQILSIRFVSQGVDGTQQRHIEITPRD
ncbi:MAG: cellulase family glycosylhydrolase [Pseudomonadales bacterium]|nr:cellulase family glycosylhydrolase [Pseudomonadales bacterium]